MEAVNHFINEEEEEETVYDSFDVLPDDVLLTIFQKLHDAKALCLSMCVCTRFREIAPQVHEISYDITPKRPTRGLKSPTQQTHKATLKSLLTKTLMKPFHLLSQMMIKLKSKSEEDDLDFYSFYLPNRVLKPFETVRSLTLRLPCHSSKPSKQLNDSSSNLLKWRADFGREIRSCMILGAKSWDVDDSKNPQKEMEQETEQVMSEGELKLRIVWTISCLIAASARHYLIQETLRDQKAIENLVVSDEIEQGIMCMDKEGIHEMREKLIKEELSSSSSSSSSSSDDESVMELRSKVPALKMKMWHLDRVEVSGKVMKGATLVVIRPADDAEDVKKMKHEELVMDAFGEDLVLGEAVRKLMVAKRCYTLEMNSF